MPDRNLVDHARVSGLRPIGTYQNGDRFASRTDIKRNSDRRAFIGGSDGRSSRREGRRRPAAPGVRNAAKMNQRNCQRNLIVQLGAVTEELNRRWYEANSGQVVTDVQLHMPIIRGPVDG